MSPNIDFSISSGPACLSQTASLALFPPVKGCGREPHNKNHPNKESKNNMKTTHRIVCLIVAVALQLLAASTAQASYLPLIFKGYYAVTNSAFVDPADPAHLQIRVGGSGAASQIGRFSISTTDQRLDFATGLQTGTINMEDSDGHKLTGIYSGPSAQQPDGRFTFGGQIVFNGGTGPFANASGSVKVDGWARVNPETGTGIGLVSFQGYLRGAAVRPTLPFAAFESLDALVGADGFTAAGDGYATRLGRFRDVNATVASPFNGFVGIVDGKFTAIYAFDSVWTTPPGDELHLTAVETVSFATILLPDGTPVPDITQPSRAKVYQTILGGTGRFAGAEGVFFGNALFTPTGTDENGALIIDGKLSGIGALTPRR